METNFFQVTSFFWAGVAVISRIVMKCMGERWKTWEMQKFYKQKRPFFIIVIGAAGILLVLSTWVQVVSSDVPYSWILAVLVSLTMVKILVLLGDYQAFCTFAENTLQDASKMMKLNTAVLLFAVGLVLIGVFLY